jgi:transposase
MQSSVLPVDPRAQRAKTDVIDVEILLRSLMAWLRGEPRVCSMVPIPDEADEEARRAHREREDLITDRLSILNKIDASLPSYEAVALALSASAMHQATILRLKISMMT